MSVWIFIKKTNYIILSGNHEINLLSLINLALALACSVAIITNHKLIRFIKDSFRGFHVNFAVNYYFLSIFSGPYM